MKKTNNFNKRKAETTSLKEGIELFLEAFKIKEKFKETNVLASWERIMGKSIASRTTNIYIRKKTLFVTISSAPLKQELQMSKSKVIELINKEVGNETITDVVIR